MEEVKNRLVGMVDQMFGPSIAVAMSEGKDVFATQGGPVPTEGDYLDSLDRIEFGMAIEEEFDITVPDVIVKDWRSEEHTSELQSLMRISYAVFCLKKKTKKRQKKYM